VYRKKSAFRRAGKLPWNRSARPSIGIPEAAVLADAGYGSDTEFRDGITQLGLVYVMGIQSSVTVWPPG
jgi:hypothetical protein